MALATRMSDDGWTWELASKAQDDLDGLRHSTAVAPLVEDVRFQVADSDFSSYPSA